MQSYIDNRDPFIQKKQFRTPGLFTHQKVTRVKHPTGRFKKASLFSTFDGQLQ